jgi:8-oxo-dGTP diphosphatase
MVKVELSGSDHPPEAISYVAIAARFNNGWLFVKHRRRGGYELPAGHPEEGESSESAAARELAEETGAESFTLEPLTFYSVDSGSGKQYGRLFLAEVVSLGEICDSKEIESVKVFNELPGEISLKEVMTFLFRTAEEFVRCNRC